MWYIILIVLVLAMILSVLFLTPKTVFKPVWYFEGFGQINPESESIIQVLTPLKGNLLIPDNVEDKINYIKNNFLDVDYDSYLEFLKQKGQIYWKSDSGTYTILKIKNKNLPGNPTLYNDMPATLNKEAYWTFNSKKIVIVHYNLSLDSIKPLTQENFTKEFNLQAQGLTQSYPQTKVINDVLQYYSESLNAKDSTVGIIKFSTDPTSNPDFYLMQDLARTLGYNEDKFIEQTETVIPAENEYGFEFIPTEYNLVSQLNEPTLDLQSIFSVNPDSRVIIFNPIVPGGYLNLLPLWSSLKVPGAPNMWSSSYAYKSKTSIYDDSRCNQEHYLLWQLGINTFQSSGDFGPLTSQLSLSSKIDVTKPDLLEGVFNSSYTISIGGVTKDINDNWITMPRLPTADDPKYIYVSSGGGFQRGYHTDPEWKRQKVQTYSDPDSIQFKINSSWYSSFIPVEIDIQGRASPDIVSFSYGKINSSGSTAQNLIYTGTSAASPAVASYFALVQSRKGQRIFKILHDLYNVDLTKRILNTRTFSGNLAGYQAVSDAEWDPVQGLGILDTEKIISFYS